MTNVCTCDRDSYYGKEYLVKGFIEDFGENEEWWDAMSDFHFDGEIVILELTDNQFIGKLESQFDLDECLEEIGNVKMGDWEYLIKIIGENEVMA